MKSYYINAIEFEGHGYNNQESFKTDAIAMDRILKQLSAMLSYHSRVLVIRIDLHPANYTENNHLLSLFIKTMKKWLKTNYRFTHIGYVWCREQHTSQKQHYHFAWILDAHKINYPSKVNDKSKQLWEKLTAGFCYIPENCFYKIEREQYQSESMIGTIARLSYLAKDRGKSATHKKANNYGGSRLYAKE